MVQKGEERKTRVECMIIILSGKCCSSLPALIPPRMCRHGVRQEVISDICGIN